MEKIVGINKNGEAVTISPSVNNSNMIVTGMSGVGKTSFCITQCIMAAENGEKCIVFNWKNSVNKTTMFPPLMERYKKYTTVVNVANEGIKLPLFRPYDGIAESNAVIAQRVSSLLKRAANLSPTQESYVYKAALDIMEKELYPSEGIACFDDWLLSMDRATAYNAAAKLRGFFATNTFRDGNFLDEDFQIIEFDLNGLEYEAQTLVVNFMTDYLYRLSHKGRFMQKSIKIFIDEAQNLDFKDSSVMYFLMNESRKLNFQALLAFPSLFAGDKKGMEVVTQAGTCVYFQPASSDRAAVAKLIDPINPESYLHSLAHLGKGEFIAKGIFCVGDKLVEKGIKLNTYITQGERRNQE